MKRPSFRQLLALGVVALVLTVLGGVWLLGTAWGRRHIEQLVRTQLAQRSDLVLAPFQVDISVFRDFPHLTVSLRHISLTDTSYRRRVEVLRVGRADMRLELKQLLRRRLQVSRLALRDAAFYQFTDSLGHDWGLRGKGPRKADPAAPPDFVLDSLTLINCRIKDRNELHHSGYAAYVQRGALSARVLQGHAYVGGTLRGQLEYLRSGRGNLFVQEPVWARVRYRYHFRQREGTFANTQATLNGDTVLVNGTHQGAAPGQPRGTRLNLTFAGNQPLLEVLRVALPPGLHRFLGGASSPSHARIHYTIRGTSGPTVRPRTVLTFRMRNGTVQWTDSVRHIRRWDVQGVFDNGPSHSPRTTLLALQHCRIYSSAGELDAAVTVRDFTRPMLTGRVRGRTELQNLAAVVAPGFWRARQGRATLDVTLDGPLPARAERPKRLTLGRHRSRYGLRVQATRVGATITSGALPPLAARGTVTLENAAFVVPGRGAEISDLNVRVGLRDSIWTLENLTGQLNGMHVQANATTTYLLAYLTGQYPTTHIAGSFAVDEMRLDRLRRLLTPPRSKAQVHRRARQRALMGPKEQAARALTALPPGLRLNIKLQCGRLLLPLDTLHNLAATVRHNGKRVELLNLRTTVWGGQVDGAVSWSTDTLRAQEPVAARLNARFTTIEYRRMLAFIARPPRRPAPTAGPAYSPLRELLLAGNGQLQLAVQTVRLPAGENLTDLRLRLDKNGPDFRVPYLTFGTSAGGQGHLQGTARLQGKRLAAASTDLTLRYQTLDVQRLLQLLAALSTLPETPQDVRMRRRAARAETGVKSPFLDGTILARVHVAADRVNYAAFQGSNFKLTSRLEAGRAQLEDCTLRALGGTVSLRGGLETTVAVGHPLHVQLRLQDIQLPTLFELAQALHFDVLARENIRGSMRCEADVHTILDETFLPDLSQTYAYLRTDLRELELLDVGALQQALKFLRTKRTSHLYFEPVSPTFALDGGQLLIPALHLNSNLTDMTISGTYHLTGQANLYMGLSPLQALFGNNSNRITRIRSGEAAQRPSRGLVYINLRRTPGSKYQMRPFQKQQQRLQQLTLAQQYQQLLRTQRLDTTLRLLR